MHWKLQKLFLLFIVVALFVACATIVPNKIVIYNDTIKPITEIKYQHCNETNGGEWHLLSGLDILPSKGEMYEYPAPCVNLRAHHADGKAVGYQERLIDNFPYEWHIKTIKH